MKHDPKYDAYIEQAMKIGAASNWTTWEGNGIDAIEHHDRERFVRMLDEQVELFEHEDACIAVGTCPGCNGALSRTEDPRQNGVSELPGMWFNYRCAKDPPIGEAGPRACVWRGVDRKEPVGEN